MIRLLLFVVLFLVVTGSSVERKGKLPKKLKEISGWAFANDTTLIAHNDSGNDPILYVLNLDGSVRHEALISDVDNIDFEDITTDRKGYIYLGDIGNNTNEREDLVVYKIKTWNILNQDEVSAQAIHYSYPEQQAFPPADNERYYDSESLAYYNDSLYLFTKCRAEPFDGKCLVYQLPTKPGTYKAKRITYLRTGRRSWMLDGITSADIYKEKLYLLTYTRLMIYSFKDHVPEFDTQIGLKPISQKECVAVHKNGKIYVADEVQKIIGGGNIFVITNTKKKP